MTDEFRIAVAGGGAAGFFGAITCAESIPDGRITIFEKSPELLAKVTISGGGRCNVTHACFEPDRLAEHYPRGRRELLGPFHRWQPRDTVRWFEERGVQLKTEPDGRMFPVTDKSTTITECLIHEAREVGVEIKTGKDLAHVIPLDRRFTLGFSDGSEWICDRLLIATGGNQSSRVFQIIEKLGHTIKKLQPSLFSFNCADPRLKDLTGISVADAEVGVAGTSLKQRGPLLVTHWGLSGPAILKISAWGAPLLHEMNYQFNVQINWVPGARDAEVRDGLAECRAQHPRKNVEHFNPWSIPSRLWASITRHAGIGEDVIWNQLNRGQTDSLVRDVLRTEFVIDGKSMNKDEFVTCGGVSLDEVDFKTMQSKKCPGLYFAGEVLDIDGVTGGFNFQSAWTTGWIAGKSMGQEG